MISGKSGVLFIKIDYKRITLVFNQGYSLHYVLNRH